MPFKSLIASLLFLVPVAATAEMSFREYPLPPRATAYGSLGQTVIVGCAQGGLPMVTIIGPRPVGGPEETYVLSIDGGSESLVAAACDHDGCHLDLETVEGARAFLTGLERGAVLDIGFYRNGPGGVVRLDGSSAALGQLYASGCPKP